MDDRRAGSAMDVLRSGTPTTLIILENDLYRHLNVAEADNLLHTAHHVVTIDYLRNRTTARSGFVLPASTFAESTGTFVNNEGRAQRFFKVLNPADDVQDSWRWIGDLMVAADKCAAPPWPVFDDIVASLAREIPAFAPVAQLAPPASFRIAGEEIPRQPHRYSGRTAMHADVSVHEPQPPADPDSPLSFSMEGYQGQPPSALIPRFWAPRWNSVQSVNKFQEEVAGPLRGGNPGQRLVEPRPGAQGEYFTEVPDAFKRRDGHLLVVPGYHIFGSEELSTLAPAIAELATRPYIAVNPQDAAEFAVDKDGLMEIAFSQVSHHLPVKFLPTVPAGLAIVPMGLAGLPWNGLPFWWKYAHE
jgi:NADH-quinone oxidoreductase subunit G